MPRKLLTLLLLCGALLGAGAHARVLRLCANEGIGPANQSNTAYLLANAAFAQLPELRPVYTLLPWQRCLNEAAAGHFDGVLAASFSAERAVGLAFPTTAAGTPDTNRRMFNIGYVLLRRKGSGINWDGQQFDGSSSRAGQAIGAERGFSIVRFARERGGVVEDRFPRFDAMIESLKLGRIGAVLVDQEGGSVLLADPGFARGHEIAGPPMPYKAYYLPLSRAFAEAHPDLAQRIWGAIAKVRETPEFKTRYSLVTSGGRRRDIHP